MKKLLVGLMTVGILGTAANAACSGGSCSDVTVDYLMTLSNGTVVVGTSGDEAGLTCAASSDKYIYISAGDAGKNAMYSALLTAQTTQRKITLRTNDTTDTCYVSYVMNK